MMNQTVVPEGLAEKVAGSRDKILSELRKVIVGQDEVVDEVLMALFCGGHCLITGVPGLAKTLLVKTLSQILDLSFKRIQFTPDLMPADITGTEILDEDHGSRALRFVKGPIFGGPHLRTRAPVLRSRHADPDRARRYLSAAGSAARSLPLQRRHDLSLRRR